MDDLDSATVGNAYGVTYESAVEGQGARFQRTQESRIQYPYPGLPKQGTLEWWVKIDSGYGYHNFVLEDGMTSALIFATDIYGGDVTWPGTTKLVVSSNGRVELQMASVKYQQDLHRLIADGTSFRFGEWHSLGFSVGSQGQYLMVDGQIVASDPTYTQELGSSGNHSAPIDIPTIGESVSGFWANNQYDGGFEGVVDRFRASASQQDWCLSSARPGSAVTPTPAPASCVGDCDEGTTVTINEILTMVNIALGNAHAVDCEASDPNHDGGVTIDEILTAVNNALNGCAGDNNRAFRKLIDADLQLIPKWRELTVSHSKEEAMPILLAWLGSQGGVADVELIDGKVIRTTDTNGEHLFHVLEWDEDHTGHSPQTNPLVTALGSRKFTRYAADTSLSAEVLSPFHSEIDWPLRLVENLYEQRMVARLGAAGIAVAGNAVNTAPTTLEILDSLKNYTFIHIQTHGGYLSFRSLGPPEVVIATGVNCDTLTSEQRKTYEGIGLRCTQKGFAFNAEYIAQHFSADDFKDAWIAIDACHSFETSELADAFISKGAKVFFGWQDETNGLEHADVWDVLLPRLLSNSSAQDAWKAARVGFYPKVWDDDCRLIFWACTHHETYFWMKQASARDAYLLPIHDLPPGASDVITPSELKKLSDLGLIVHRGLQPPDVQGIYFASPWVLKNATDDVYPIGHQFIDYTYRFRDQKPDLSIVVDYYGNGGGTVDQGTGIGAFISGSGNDFTIFVPVSGTSTYESKTATYTTPTLFSGHVDTNGIVSLQSAFLMADKDDPYDVLMDVGEARMEADDDGMSPRVGSFPVSRRMLLLPGIETLRDCAVCRRQD